MSSLDALQLYCGQPYKINDYVTVKHPKFGQIMEYGEARYRQVIGALTSTPSMMISILDDIGIDWEKISDFELFAIYLRNGLTDDDCAFIFDGLRLSEFKLDKLESGQLILRSVVSGNVIDSLMYRRIADFLRRIHGMKYVVRKAGNAFTKKVMISDDRRTREQALREQTESDSSLLPIISALVNSPGFKYKLSEMMDLPYFMLMDSLHRLSIIKQSDALLNGAYCGMADLSKVPKEEFNWMRPVD